MIKLRLHWHGLMAGVCICAASASGMAQAQATPSQARPYDLWTDPCLTQPLEADSTRAELRLAIEQGGSSDMPALVCKALGILDTERWQQHWQDWHKQTDESGCGSAKQQIDWRVELFLSPHAHQIAHDCAERAGDLVTAEHAAAIRDGVIEAMLQRATGQRFDQPVPLMMPADLLSYVELLDGKVLAFWAKPYQRGTRLIFKVLMQAQEGKAQTQHYFEWALPIWSIAVAPADSARGGPWYAQLSGAGFARDNEQGAMAAAARVYAAYADFERSAKDAALLPRLRTMLQPAVQQGDLAAMFELAQYELELPGGEAKTAIDLLLSLADSGDARATAKLAMPTLLGLGGLEGGEQAAEKLLKRAAKQLAPGAAEFHAATQLAWVGSAYADEWAQRWLARSAESGLHEGMYAYAVHLNEHDQQPQARTWIERAAAGHVTAVGLLVTMIGAKEPAARPWLQDAAHWNPGAMRLLAELDEADSAKLWQRAARAGDPIAAARQARQLLALDSADADLAALRFAHWGAQHGSADALSLVVAIDLRARSQAADPARGQRMLQVLRDNDYAINADRSPELLFEIARREETGDLLKRNPRRARSSYQALAKREHPGALLRLAELESQGRVSKARSERVATLLRRAHTAGARSAAGKLAALYADPTRRIEDAAEAARWAALSEPTPSTDAAPTQ